jgi:hypothetical protein
VGGFSNPVFGGNVLIRPAVRSPNYQAGTQGWSINKDGSAEFNDLTLRGTFVGTDWIQNDDGLFFYDGTPAAGNLVGSWAQAAGTDAFGNAYAQGITTYSADGTINMNDTATTWNATPSGAGIQVAVGGGSVLEQFSPSVVSGVTWNNGAVGATLQSRLGTNTPLVFLESPTNSTTPGATATLTLYGGPQTSNGDVLSEAIVDAARTWINSNAAWVTGAWQKLNETWVTPTFNANWSGTTTYGGLSGGLRSLQYRKDAEDNLWLLGTFTAATGAGSSVFNLPSGYRPTKNTPFPVAFISSGGTAGNAWAYVSTAGNLNMNAQLGSAATAGTTYTVNAKIPLGNLA